MSIKIKIEPENQEPEQPSVQISLEMRKTLDGKLMILDHMHLDIVIDTNTSKITTFPKKEMSEEIYGFQRNYLEYLRKEGVVVEDSIRSGNVFVWKSSPVVVRVAENQWVLRDFDLP